MEKILRINMTEGKISREPVPEPWQQLGGRALIPRILLDEIPPTCAPLGAANKLIFAPGLLVGQQVSSCDRISVGCKSPLTGGIKEANAGGATGRYIVWLGYKAMIIEGRIDPQKGLQLLLINQDGAQLTPAGDLVGCGTMETAQRLQEQYGSQIAASIIGPGGEMHLHGAGIMHLDKDGYPGRISARGGVGAVMGAKGLKAIVFDLGQAKRPPVADPTLHKKIRKQVTKALLAHPQTSRIYTEYGTAAMVDMCNAYGALPTRNFSSGQFEGAEAISGDAFHDLMQARGGEADISHACMAGCVIRCSNVYADVQGKKIVSPVEYETIGLMGSNLGIDSPDMIAHLNYQINDLGLDTIEVGAALGVAAEAGLMTWGDGERALELLAEIRHGTPLGRMIGHGAATVGQVMGIERVPVIKGQAFSAYDPRAIKGTGVTYATSPQGADHTCGLTIRAQVNHTDPQGQVALSRTAQFKMAGYDSLGACIFAGFGFAMDISMVRELMKAHHGWEVDDNYLELLGRQTIALEREFNRRAGFTAADDQMPEWMQREPLPPLNSVFDVPQEEMNGIFDE